MTFFDPNQVEDLPAQGEYPPPLPKGWYRLMVDGAAVKPTQSGGTRVSVQFSVLDQQHKRKVFAGFNIKNASPEAEKIGQGLFKRFLKACGITTALQDASDLGKTHNKVVYGYLSIGKNYQSGDPENEVKDFNDKPKGEQPTKVAAASKTSLDTLPF